MKSIELTEKHKEKLLEMCKTLFPEYNDIIMFSKDQEVNYEEEDFIDFDNKHIHWFEFVMTTLCSNLYKLFFKKMDTQNNLWDLLTKEKFYI